MPMIYKRFTEKAAEEWRQIYKALQLLEFLIKNGSERVIDDARSHVSLLKMLRQFHFIDQNGKDQGINVRNRAKELAELLSDVDRIRAERKKARANRNKFGGVEGGMGMGGFSGSGGFSGGSGNSRYGGFGSESANADYGGYSGGVYGDGGGFGGNESGFQDTQRRGDKFEEYDEGDDVETSAPPPRRTQASSTQVRRDTKKEEPKSKAPEPVADLLAWDDEPTPSSSTAGKQPLATSDEFGDDDDFDDFQSAAPAVPTVPAAKPATAFIAPPASTSTIGASTQFAAPQPQSAAQNNNLNDLFATVSPPPASNNFASPPLMTPASATSNITQPYRPSGYQATGPNYFTSVPNPSAASTPSVASPSIGGVGGKIGSGAPKKAGGDAFASLLGGSGPKKASTPTQKVTMADMAKQKTSQGLWGAPASGSSTPASQPQRGSKPGALLGTTWLYLYPLFDDACAFPYPPNATAHAPFRLLALGDPQLEGDSSLPKPGAKIFRSFENLADDVRDAEAVLEKLELVRNAVKGIPKDIARALEGYIRKPIDIWGNDWYLAHIVRTLRWWTEPSHIAVLGDLLGSQWVSNEEFEKRSRRYWDIVFRGLEKVPERIMTGYEEEELNAENEGGEREKRWGGIVEILGEDTSWAKRAINIAGNHDIGYAGDIDTNRMERFERTYGKVNWDIMFTLPNTTLANTEVPNDPPALRLVILNTMNLDTPAYDGDLQRETYDFINHVVTTSRSVNDKTHATLLLTHIPLHKDSGVCVDSPFFDFFDGGGVKEQNMLSDHASKIVLESIFGLSSNQHAEGQGFGRHGIIINGHDHAGCDLLHYTTQPGVASGCPENVEEHGVHLPSALANTSTSLSIEEVLGNSFDANDTLSDLNLSSEDSSEEAESEAQNEPEPEDQQSKWQAQRIPYLPYRLTASGECIALNTVPRIREVTLRSMMGEFSGYAGFLSAWFDSSAGEKGEWKIEVNTCGLGVQHWWWAVHIVDVLMVLTLIVGGVLRLIEVKKDNASRTDDVKTMNLNTNKDSNGKVRQAQELDMS
ncbi:hypothetical protein SLS60_008200 [Paraconiothyrium brasiliense]|uniref:ENTH domain-containing protein n=1 Tax=Paraconiothyrium brasiliense TaxID=300254 RepID=A0ABR3QZX4_9PLEO